MHLRELLFDRSGIVRSGWRFLIFAAGFVAVLVIVYGVAAFLFAAFPIAPGPTTLLVNGAIFLVPSLLAGWLCGRFLEGLPFRALGAWFTQGWARHLAQGMAVGFGTLSVAIGAGMLFGRLSFVRNELPGLSATLAAFSASFAVFAVAAAFEEAFFRGYGFQTFVRSGLSVFAAVFSSLLFATVHNNNPAADLLSWTNTLLAGFWFAAAYLKTRDLWMPFGMHLMWNWCQGSVFGVEVSGLTDITRLSLLKEIDAGPAFVTGGDYGIEGGIACTLALLLSTVAIFLSPFFRPGAEMLQFVQKPSDRLDLE